MDDFPTAGLAGPSAQSHVAEKGQLEAAMSHAPEDRELRESYFDLLQHISLGRTGLGWALLPEIGHPLFFRHGSSDIANMKEIFLHGRYGAKLKSAPRYILDLGAYVGYAAVYLAQRFPNAAILCVEPMTANFRLLLLNTLPYRQITCRNIAVWGHAAQLTPHAISGGESGMQLADGVERGGIACQALTVTSVLQSAGWSRVDLVKCNIEGGEASVFADPQIAWFKALDALMIKIHDDVLPSASRAVAACFDAGEVQQSRYGDIEVFERKKPFHTLFRPAPREIALINPGPEIGPLLVQDVDPVPWGFFTFDGTSCQLHPNPPGAGAPARVIFPRLLNGQSRALAWVMHAGVQAPPVRFVLQVVTEDGQLVAEAMTTVLEGGQQAIEVTFAPAVGPHLVILQTEIEPGISHNLNAWARWINPRLVR